MRPLYRFIACATAIIALSCGALQLSRAQRWHYSLTRSWKSPDAQYIVNAYRRELPFVEAALYYFSEPAWLMELVDAKSGALVEESEYRGLAMDLSVHWTEQECRYALLTEPWQLPNPLSSLDYAYKPKVRPDQQRSKTMPACLQSLGFSSLTLSPLQEPVTKEAVPRNCRPGNRTWLDQIQGPTSNRLRKKEQESFAQLHRNLNPYRDVLAGLSFDDQSQSLLVVFKQGALPLPVPELKVKLSQDTGELKLGIRERCFSQAQIECARRVIARKGLWLTPGTEYLAVLERSVGDFQVQIKQDPVSAKTLKALLGPLVRIKIVYRIE